MRLVDAETDLLPRLPLHRGTWGRWQLGEHTWPDLGAMSENERCSTSLVRWVSGRHKGGGGHSCATAQDMNNTRPRSSSLPWSSSAAGRAAGVQTAGRHPEGRRTGCRAAVLGAVDLRCRVMGACTEN